MFEAIRSEDQYEQALARVYDLMQMDIIENSPEFRELEKLGVLVQAYEKEHYPIRG